MLVELEVNIPLFDRVASLARTVDMPFLPRTGEDVQLDKDGGVSSTVIWVCHQAGEAAAPPFVRMYEPGDIADDIKREWRDEIIPVLVAEGWHLSGM